MKNRKTHVPMLFVTGLAVMLSPMAFAQEAAQSQAQQRQDEATMQETPPSSSWETLDKDGNGRLSKTEAAVVPSLSQIFDQADSNQDGELDQDEYKAFLNAGQTEPTQADVKK